MTRQDNEKDTAKRRHKSRVKAFEDRSPIPPFLSSLVVSSLESSCRGIAAVTSIFLSSNCVRGWAGRRFENHPLQLNGLFVFASAGKKHLSPAGRVTSGG